LATSLSNATTKHGGSSSSNLSADTSTTSILFLPLPGLPERQTHDYQRHGTTTLFAAFNILNGKVIGTCQQRHRSREFIRLLNYLEKQLPPDQEIHFTPTSSSWLNQVERFFALITDRMIRRGAFYSTQELEAAIYLWLANWNRDLTPFVWKASADVILAKVRRCKELSKTAD
jgi:transposase